TAPAYGGDAKSARAAGVGGGPGVSGGRHVVVVPAVLVVRDDEQCPVPAGTIPQGGVHVVHQLFPQGDVVVGVLAVAARAEARLEERVGGQRPRGGAVRKGRGGAGVALRGQVRRRGG